MALLAFSSPAQQHHYDQINIIDLHNLYPEQIVLQRVDDDEDVTELCGKNSTPVVSPVFRPHNVHLVKKKQLQ